MVSFGLRVRVYPRAGSEPVPTAQGRVIANPSHRATQPSRRHWWRHIPLPADQDQYLSPHLLGIAVVAQLPIGIGVSSCRLTSLRTRESVRPPRLRPYRPSWTPTPLKPARPYPSCWRSTSTAPEPPRPRSRGPSPCGGRRLPRERAEDRPAPSFPRRSDGRQRRMDISSGCRPGLSPLRPRGVIAGLEPVTHVTSRRLRSLHPNTETADLEGTDAAGLRINPVEDISSPAPA
ncbi:hypothetical protein B0H03_11911 [Rathayibacter iranicus NCPPB 2253 = VKM Ac-1602]|uniref:Uncharacterized protein n=1 Tax=Rathayibacter iranicus NCPPB 2253 = VKM Ac-1602 TaxID=1328868 RepID=A0ABX5L8H2_9MICO|nr:hypothetical protein B0H03_11911 [Rathayibacter iranicus NCPPB 2253 = VKM Ac-1602]